MPQFHLRIAKPDQVFSAAHFITVAAGTCERLHGHNYRVAAEVHGPLGEHHYVFDFLALHETLRAIIDQLDHRVLLPTNHPRIRVKAGPEEVEVTFAGRRWVFPRSDCSLLPIPSTTAELLAQHLGRRLFEELESRFAIRPALVRIELEESPGLAAVCELPGQ